VAAQVVSYSVKFEELKRLTDSVMKSAHGIDAYNAQIVEAKRMGKASFDRDKFMKNRSKSKVKKAAT
jgi:hypothetical protein